MPELSPDSPLAIRLADLSRRGESAAAAVIDLRGVEHGHDSRFTRSLLRYLESWAAPAACETYPAPDRRMLVLAGPESKKALQHGAEAMADALRSHGFGEARTVHYDLPADIARLAAELAPRRDRRGGAATAAAAAMAIPVTATAFGRLLDVERALEGADVEPLLREETVWSMADPAAPTAVMTELAISLDELEARLDVPLRRDEWLRHEAAVILDHGLLRHIARDRARGERRLSFDLHVATVLDPRFTALARAIPAETRARLTAELPAWEAAVSAPRFAAAAERLHDQGFSVAVDRAPLDALAAVDVAGLDIAWIKAAWPMKNPGAAVAAVEAERRLRDGVARFGAERLILWRCADAAALATGKAAGVLLFQGAAADQAAATVTAAERMEAMERAAPPDEESAEDKEDADDGAGEEGRGLFARWFGRD
jgi:hypothetical protein